MVPNFKPIPPKTGNEESGEEQYYTLKANSRRRLEFAARIVGANR